MKTIGSKPPNKLGSPTLEAQLVGGLGQYVNHKLGPDAVVDQQEVNGYANRLQILGL